MPQQVNGVTVESITPVPWNPSDDFAHDGEGWSVIGRALVRFPQGGLANGLVLHRSIKTWPHSERAVVVWERPREGGEGRFRLLSLEI